MPPSAQSTPPKTVVAKFHDPYSPPQHGTAHGHGRGAQAGGNQVRRENAQAELMGSLEDRRVRLDGLRNSFGTKQSMIRKKYGVRLRERRTKAEIEAERLRN